jgi:hypothetical protein
MGACYSKSTGAPLDSFHTDSKRYLSESFHTLTSLYGGIDIQHHINVNQTTITVTKERNGSMINPLRWFKYVVPLLFDPKYADL